MDATWILRCNPGGSGMRVAVKDLIDVEGIPTTAGCRAMAEVAEPAKRDARCLDGARSAGARIVGKTNLHELALGVTGINPWFGTPVNPLDPTRVPGGSSSGSAVAVATGDADVALGSDTGGSIRIPAACCGVAGLKTTWGRIPVEGVKALAPSLDTIGPMARDVAGLVAGMQLLEPSFAIAVVPSPVRVARVRGLPLDTDPRVELAIDDALHACGWEVADASLPGWSDATRATTNLLVAEAWAENAQLVQTAGDGIGDDVRRRLLTGGDLDQAQVAAAHDQRRAWTEELQSAWDRFDLLATPVLSIFAPHLHEADRLLTARFTMPVNLAGVPALALPVPAPGSALPASLQLIGPAGSEELLLAAGLAVEAAVAR